MKRIQTQGVHHLTLIGADRQTSIDFFEGVLGMPFIFEQPNLDQPAESHLYFDPGDGCLVTVFTNEQRRPDPMPTPESIGSVHHIAFNVSRATFTQVGARLEERGITHSGEIDRGFMYSIYFRDPLGQRFELSTYKFFPPPGVTEAEVLHVAGKLKEEAGDYNITDKHLADALEILTRQTTRSLSDDRSPKNPYRRDVAGP